jgi:hypothetical protein
MVKSGVGRGSPGGVSGAVGGDREVAKWRHVDSKGSSGIELNGNGCRVLKRGTGGGVIAVKDGEASAMRGNDRWRWVPLMASVSTQGKRKQGGSGHVEGGASIPGEEA